MWNARVNHFLSVVGYLICSWQQHHISVIHIVHRNELNNQYTPKKKTRSEETHIQIGWGPAFNWLLHFTVF